jgi:hypothetical protein
MSARFERITYTNRFGEQRWVVAPAAHDTDSAALRETRLQNATTPDAIAAMRDYTQLPQAAEPAPAPAPEQSIAARGATT